MNAAIISPDYRVLVPKEVREVISLTPGQSTQVFAYDSRVELVLERKIQELRGFLEGMNTSLHRDTGRCAKTPDRSMTIAQTRSHDPSEYAK